MVTEEDWNGWLQKRTDEVMEKFRHDLREALSHLKGHKLNATTDYAVKTITQNVLRSCFGEVTFTPRAAWSDDRAWRIHIDPSTVVVTSRVLVTTSPSGSGHWIGYGKYSLTFTVPRISVSFTVTEDSCPAQTV